MHMLGHSFSQRRKSSKPRDLHIRKVSFSGSSLSSGCSFSSSSSTSTARAPASNRTASGGFDPLNLHPTFQPPPRLYDRPLIQADSQRYDDSAMTFYDDDEGEDGSVDRYLEHYLDSDNEYDVTAREVHEQPADMELPPHSSPMDHGTHETQEPQDYFLFQLSQRPPMPRSRWSESTVHTLEQLTPSGGGSLTPGGVSDPEPLVGGRHPLNFSWKRATVPKRPPIRTLDSFDNYIKRGGWKRRGIVFNHSEMEEDEADGGLSI